MINFTWLYLIPDKDVKHLFKLIYKFALYEISTGKKKNLKSMEMLGVSLP